MDKKDFAIWTVLYTVLLSIGSLVLVYARASNEQTAVSWLRIVSVIVACGLFAALIAAIQLMAMKSGAAIWLGSSATPVTPLTLSRVRTLIRQESWLEAREELAGLWELFPGNADILQEYEHVMVDRMHAPSGFADFLIKAVPVLKGDEKAYALFRIAELFAGELDRKSEAGLWCHRLLVEHPGSNYEGQARKILEILPPPPKTTPP